MRTSARFDYLFLAKILRKLLIVSSVVYSVILISLLLIEKFQTCYCFSVFEITGDPCNLIGSQQWDLFPNRTIFCSKSHLFFIQ